MTLALCAAALPVLGAVLWLIDRAMPASEASDRLRAEQHQERAAEHTLYPPREAKAVGTSGLSDDDLAHWYSLPSADPQRRSR